MLAGHADSMCLRHAWLCSDPICSQGSRDGNLTRDPGQGCCSRMVLGPQSGLMSMLQCEWMGCRSEGMAALFIEACADTLLVQCTGPCVQGWDVCDAPWLPCPRHEVLAALPALDFEVLSPQMVLQYDVEGGLAQSCKRRMCGTSMRHVGLRLWMHGAPHACSHLCPCGQITPGQRGFHGPCTTIRVLDSTGISCKSTVFVPRLPFSWAQYRCLSVEGCSYQAVLFGEHQSVLQPAYGHYVLQRQHLLACNSFAFSFSPEAIEPTQRASMSVGEGFWHAIEAWLTCFGRSCILFYLLACMHMWLWCIPCRAGKERTNRGIRAARGCLKGAPLVWAFCIVAYKLPVVTAMPSSSCGGISLTSDVEQAVVNRLGSDHLGHEGMFEGDASGANIRGAPSLVVPSDFKLQVEIVQFQRPSFGMSVPLDGAVNMGHLRATVIYELDLDVTLSDLIPVSPQPSVDVAVFLAAPVWMSRQMQCPVLFQIGEPFSCQFMDFLVGAVGFHDVRLAVGDYWMPGACIFAGDSAYPLDEDGLCQVSPGMLIRIVGRGRAPAVKDLDYKLQHANVRLRNLTTVPALSFQSVGSAVGAIGPLADWQTFQVDEDMCPHDLKRAIVEACGVPETSFGMRTPCRQPYDLAFRGVAVSSVVGVVPRSLDACSCVFVDPRELGKPVCVLMLPPVPTTIASILQRIQAPHPAGCRLIVQGAPSFVQSTQMFIPGQATLISFQVEALMKEEDVGDGVHPNAAAVPPRLCVTSACSAGGAVLHNMGGPDHVGTPTEVGLHSPPHRDDSEVGSHFCERDGAIDVCADVGPPLWAEGDGGSTVIIGKQERDLQLGLPSDIGRDIVFRASDMEAVNFAVPAPGFLPDQDNARPDEDDPDSEQEGESADTTTDDEPLEWLMLIRVLRFQRPAELRALYVSSQDSVESFLQRATIILAPIGGFWELLIPEVQPDLQGLTVLIAPVWWRQSQVNAFVIIPMGPQELPFMQVARPQDEWGALLPLHGQDRDEQLHAFADFVIDSRNVVDWPMPPPGATVALGRSGEEIPDFPTAQNVLGDPRHAIRAVDIPHHEQRPGMQYGLLGIGFEQYVFHMRTGAVAPQVSQFTQIDPSELVLWVQLAPFDDVEIQGQDVGRCMGFRSNAMISRNSCTALFIDGRLVGRPICCRPLHNNTLMPQDVLNLLEVQLPDGYRPFQIRVRSEHATEGPLQFLHCQSVKVWAVRTHPDVAPRIEMQVDTDASDDGEDAHDDSTSDADPAVPRGDGGSSGRSRSPRRSNDGVPADKMAARTRRHVPTPCRNAGNYAMPRSMEGAVGCIKVHAEVSRFSRYGVFVAMTVTDKAEANEVIQGMRASPGEFFWGDLGLMWMPGIWQHARIPRHLADTPEIQDSSVNWDVCPTTVLYTSPRLGWYGHLRRIGAFLFQSHDMFHEHGAHPNDVTSAGNGPCPLRLEALLPMGKDGYARRETEVPSSAVQFQLDAGQCVTPWDDSFYDDLHRYVHPAQFRAPPPCLHRPDRFSGWVNRGSKRTLGPDEVLIITTDGSFSPATGNSGWGLVMAAASSPTCEDSTFIGCCWGSLLPFTQEPDSQIGDPDAFKAEVVGMFWAAVCAVQTRSHNRVCFRTDNIAALGIASGSCRHADATFLHATRALHQSIAVSSFHPPLYLHVRGHMGDAANELADALADWASERQQESGPFTISLAQWLACQGAAFRWVAHACWSKAHSYEGPGYTEGVLQWNRQMPGLSVPPEDVLKPFLPAPRVEISSVVCKSHLNMNVATYNCLSIKENQVPLTMPVPNPLREVGRAKLLAASLRASNVHLAGIQESREGPGCHSCGSFCRLATGSDGHGNYGVELWVELEQPFAWIDGRPARLQASDFIIIHSCPTSLRARLSHAAFQATILVAHAPHRAHTEEVRCKWWASLLSRCASLDIGDPWIILADANCRLGSMPSEHVGTWCRDDEDVSGMWFHKMLEALRLFAPNTFEAFSQGPMGTIQQKRNASFARGDYVGVPLSWKSHHVCAFTDPSISAGHQVIDHIALVVRIRAEVVMADTPPRPRASVIDAQATLDPANHEVVKAIIDDIPEVPWHVNVHEHCAILTSHLQRKLADRFPLTQRRFRADYFTQRTQDLHRLLCKRRNKLRYRCQALRFTRLRCAFLQWKLKEPDNGRRFDLSERFSGSWLAELRVHIAMDTWHIQQVSGLLRRSCKQDKTARLTQLAQEVGRAKPCDVHAACNKVLRPKRRRQAGARPLPFLVWPDGKPCESPEETMQCWRSHFAALEAGQTVQPAELVLTCVGRQTGRLGPETIWHEHMPSMGEVEQALRLVAPNKARGPDGLPTGICRRFSVSLCAKLWPMVLKTLCYAGEAIGHKGGVLFHLPKPGGDATRCTGSRGVLAQSALSKVVHKATRRLAVDRLDATGQAFRIGGRRGFSPNFGPLFSRSFLKFARRVGLNPGIVFVDISSAYYCVVRQLVTGNTQAGESVQSVAASLGLSTEDLQALTAWTCEDPVLGESDADVLRLLCEDFHAQTWQVLSGDSVLTETKRGSRPGSAWADTFFGLLFERILGRRSTSYEVAVAPAIPWNQKRHLEPVLQPGEETLFVSASDIVYADDLAVPTGARSAADLGSAISEVTTSIVDVFCSHGLRANFAPGKTAAIAAPAGVGSRQAKCALFVQGKGRLPILSEHNPVCWLPLVPHYKHLGVIVDHKASMHPEVVRRVHLCRAAFREGRKMLYVNPHIPLARRASLFQSNVLGVLLHGSGIWPWLLAGTFRVFMGAVMSFYRQMVRIRHDAEQNWSRSQILAFVDLPAPQCLLHVERLRFLCLLVRSGPDALWAVVRFDAEYVFGVKRALEWLFDCISTTCGMGHPEQCWDDWVQLIGDRPGLFRGWIKRACAIEGVRVACHAALQTATRAVWHMKTDSYVSPADHELHACLPCCLAFSCRQAWGAHAARCHGYRAQHTVVASGRTCQACGKTYANPHRLRRHLSNSAKCLRVAMTCGHGPADCTVGHDQAPPAFDTGVHAFEAPEQMITSPFVQQLQEARLTSFEELWTLVKQMIGPLPEIRAAVSSWAASAPAPEVQAAAGRVLALLYPRAMGAKCKTRGIQLDLDEPQDAVQPQLRPFPETRVEAGPVGVLGLIDRNWLEFIGVSDRPCQELDWCSPPSLEAAMDFAALWIEIPPAPSKSTVPWIPDAASLKATRAFAKWCDLSLSWISLGFLLAYRCKPVHWAMSDRSSGVLQAVGWIRGCGGVQGIEGFVSFCFTRIH